jgi:esterase/lipase
MHSYNQSLSYFKSIRLNHQNNGVLESDLPFLFENKENNIGILMLHGSEATPCNTYALGEIMFNKGYTVLGGLLQGHGLNSNILHSGNVSWRDCYNSAIEYLSILNDMVDKVYVLGSSFGGALVYLMGVEYHNNISGVISISAPTYTDFNPPEHRHWLKQIHGSIKAVEHNIHHLNLPVLIMHSVDDRIVKVNQAFHAFDNVKTEQKKLLMYNKIGHNLGFGFNTEEVANDIDNFIKNYSEQTPIRFEFKTDNANSVSIAGEFNNWNSKSNPMYKVNQDTWIVDLNLSSGKYQYKLVINENQWILDPNAKKVPTPKGEYNSLVIV